MKSLRLKEKIAELVDEGRKRLSKPPKPKTAICRMKSSRGGARL